MPGERRNREAAKYDRKPVPEKDDNYSAAFWSRMEQRAKEGKTTIREVEAAMMKNIQRAARKGQFELPTGFGPEGSPAFPKELKEELSAYRKMADKMGIHIGEFIKDDEREGGVIAPIEGVDDRESVRRQNRDQRDDDRPKRDRDRELDEDDRRKRDADKKKANKDGKDRIGETEANIVHRRATKDITKDPKKDPRYTPDYIPPVQQEAAPKPIKSLISVDISDKVDLMARVRADKQLTEVLNNAGFFKRMWMTAGEDGYRQKFIQEQQDKILGLPKKGFFRRMQFWRKDEQTAKGKENLFADPAFLAEHREELEAVMERFQQGYIRDQAATEEDRESKFDLTDQRYSHEINQLIRDYAVNETITDEEFNQRKYQILGNIKRDNPAAFDKGQMSADNFLEAAKQYRKIYDHGRGIANLDINLRVELGIAKNGIKTEANQNWVDKMIKKIERVPGLGQIGVPVAAGVAVSVGAYLLKKPAYAIVGVFGASGIFSALRRNKQVKMDVAMHRAEAAMGTKLSEYGAAPKRREKMGEFVYDMRTADSIKETLRILRTQIEDEAPPEVRQQLLTEIIDAEARMSLGEQHNLDMISYTGETQLERSRLDLLRELAQAKVALGVNNPGLRAQIDQRCAELQETNIDEVDAKFKRFKRWEVIKAGAVGALIGGTIGTAIGALSQQGMAEIGYRPGGRATSIEHLLGWHRGGGTAGTEAGQGFIDSPFPGVRIPAETHFEADSVNPGHWWLMGPNNSKLGEFAQDGQGNLVGFQETFQGLGHTSTIEHGGGGNQGTMEWLNSLGGKHHQMQRDMWMDNNTPHKFDLNELGGRYGGINNSGFTADGKLDFDLSHLHQGGSFHGHDMVNIHQAMANGELKIAITPDGAHAGEVIYVDIGPDGHAITNDAWVKEMFQPGANGGKPQFMGKTWEVVQMMGHNPNGADKVRVLATVLNHGPGKSNFGGGGIDTEITTFSLLGHDGAAAPQPDTWAAWAMPMAIGRKPLEAHQKKRFGATERVSPEIQPALSPDVKEVIFQTLDGQSIKAYKGSKEFLVLSPEQQTAALEALAVAIKQTPPGLLRGVDIILADRTGLSAKGDWIKIDGGRSGRDIIASFKDQLELAARYRALFCQQMAVRAFDIPNQTKEEIDHQAQTIVAQGLHTTDTMASKAVWLRAGEIVLEQGKQPVFTAVRSTKAPDEDAPAFRPRGTRGGQAAEDDWEEGRDKRVPYENTHNEKLGNYELGLDNKRKVRGQGYVDRDRKKGERPPADRPERATGPAVKPEDVTVAPERKPETAGLSIASIRKDYETKHGTKLPVLELPEGLLPERKKEILQDLARTIETIDPALWTAASERKLNKVVFTYRTSRSVKAGVMLAPDGQPANFFEVPLGYPKEMAGLLTRLLRKLESAPAGQQGVVAETRPAIAPAETSGQRERPKLPDQILIDKFREKWAAEEKTGLPDLRFTQRRRDALKNKEDALQKDLDKLGELLKDLKFPDWSNVELLMGDSFSTSVKRGMVEINLPMGKDLADLKGYLTERLNTITDRRGQTAGSNGTPVVRSGIRSSEIEQLTPPLPDDLEGIEDLATDEQARRIADRIAKIIKLPEDEPAEKAVDTGPQIKNFDELKVAFPNVEFASAAKTQTKFDEGEKGEKQADAVHKGLVKATTKYHLDLSDLKILLGATWDFNGPKKELRIGFRSGDSELIANNIREMVLKVEPARDKTAEAVTKLGQDIKGAALNQDPRRTELPEGGLANIAEILRSNGLTDVELNTTEAFLDSIKLPPADSMKGEDKDKIRLFRAIREGLTRAQKDLQHFQEVYTQTKRARDKQLGTLKEKEKLTMWRRTVDALKVSVQEALEREYL